MRLLEFELMLAETFALIPAFSPLEKGNIFPLLVGLIALAVIQSVVEPQ